MISVRMFGDSPRAADSAGVGFISTRMQAAGLIHIPYEAFLILPFVLTIVAMAFMSRNAVAPTALLKPFRKEER